MTAEGAGRPAATGSGLCLGGGACGGGPGTAKVWTGPLGPSKFQHMKISEKAVRKALRTVKDPELHLDLVVLGLVYDIEIEDANVQVRISLTTPMCPAAPQIVEDARAAVAGVEGVENAEVQLTFDPPWTPERISPLIRSSLGL